MSSAVRNVSPNMIGKDGRVRVKMIKGGRAVYRRVAPVDAREYVKHGCGEIDPDPSDLASHPAPMEEEAKTGSPGNNEPEIIDFSGFTVPNLKVLADELKVEYDSDIKKADLIALLQETVGSEQEFNELLETVSFDD